MATRALYRFNNTHSVRFNLDSFALPVTATKKKNSIYADYVSGLLATKRQLLAAPAPIEKYGYLHAAKWRDIIFVSDDKGVYYRKYNQTEFYKGTAETLFPQQLLVTNDRLFIISGDRLRIVYSVPLSGGWSENSLLSAALYIPEVYGKCRHLTVYRNKLLAVCDYGLVTVDRHLNLQHLSDDSAAWQNSLASGNDPAWVSDWFSLGYATDTQNLREVFLKTDVALTLVVESNRTQRTIQLTASRQVQKIKINLNGDQFKIGLYPSSASCNISDLSAVVVYGQRG